MKLEDRLNIKKNTPKTNVGSVDLYRLAAAFFFIIAVAFFAKINLIGSSNTILIVAAAIGAYMALNIGANDVANNVSAAVGSKALTLAGAIVIAAIFEASGALIAGGDVVSTIKKGIIDPGQIQDANTFIWLMLAALLAGAIWLNVATAIQAPVSTTHSIVGGVLGAGIAAGGWGIADWDQVGRIAASWVISPVLGGIFAAGLLYIIKITVMYHKDVIHRAGNVVPLLIALMAWAFGTYILLKGFKNIWKVDLIFALSSGFALAVVTFLTVNRNIRNKAEHLDNSKQGVDGLFTIPLICAAALLSFAHGANDVANAVGPLAAINDALMSGEVRTKAGIPLWIMVIGALGIVIGLALYGARLIKTVGSEITDLNKTRAFCVALAAAITVIIASQLGLPVSSTHITVGAIFGVGFLREYLKFSYAKRIEKIKRQTKNDSPEKVRAFLDKFEAASVKERGEMLKVLKQKQKADAAPFTPKERKQLKKAYHKELVRRSEVMKIAVAWLVTVPVSALLAALIYFTIRGMLLP